MKAGLRLVVVYQRGGKGGEILELHRSKYSVYPEFVEVELPWLFGRVGVIKKQLCGMHLCDEDEPQAPVPKLIQHQWDLEDQKYAACKKEARTNEALMAAQKVALKRRQQLKACLRKHDAAKHELKELVQRVARTKNAFAGGSNQARERGERWLIKLGIRPEDAKKYAMSRQDGAEWNNARMKKLHELKVRAALSAYYPVRSVGSVGSVGSTGNFLTQSSPNLEAAREEQCTANDGGGEQELDLHGFFVGIKIKSEPASSYAKALEGIGVDVVPDLALLGEDDWEEAADFGMIKIHKKKVKKAVDKLRTEQQEPETLVRQQQEQEMAAELHQRLIRQETQNQKLHQQLNRQETQNQMMLAEMLKLSSGMQEIEKKVEHAEVEAHEAKIEMGRVEREVEERNNKLWRAQHKRADELERQLRAQSEQLDDVKDWTREQLDVLSEHVAQVAVKLPQPQMIAVTPPDEASVLIDKGVDQAFEAIEQALGFAEPDSSNKRPPSVYQRYCKGAVKKGATKVTKTIQKLNFVKRAKSRAINVVTLYYICPFTGDTWLHQTEEWKKWVRMGIATVRLGLAVIKIATTGDPLSLGTIAESWKSIQTAGKTAFKMAHVDPTAYLKELTKNSRLAAKKLAIMQLKKVLLPGLQKQGLEWADVVPVLETIDSVEELTAAMENPMVYLQGLSKSSGPAAKKLAIMHLQQPLTPYLHAQGLEWADVVPVLEAVESIAELTDGVGDLEGLLEKLAEPSGPAAKKLAIMQLKKVLLPGLQKQGLEWADVVPVLETIESVEELKGLNSEGLTDYLSTNDDCRWVLVVRFEINTQLILIQCPTPSPPSNACTLVLSRTRRRKRACVKR
jgi:hypothetical protein